jgi:Testicular haploid expressed repeat
MAFFGYPRNRCCCNKFDPIPKHHHHSGSATKRIALLARPKYYRPKFQRRPVQRYTRHIQVVRSLRFSTRLKQLAYPKVRKLLATKAEYKIGMDQQRLDRFNKTIKESLRSMYSRLHGVSLPLRKLHPRWTIQQWINHYEWLNERAQPKKVPSSPKPSGAKKPLQELLPRLQELAQPKYITVKRLSDPLVRHTALKYQPTERIGDLATPKMPRKKGRIRYSMYYRVKPGAKKFKSKSQIKPKAQF